jgi:predicted metal-dependent phosphoesterase TrpH
VGKAILHLHSTFSDGMANVDELLDEVENNSDIDIIGITDHDDCRSFAATQAWKARHPGSRVQAIWGSEVTAFGFTHVLAFRMQPPFPTTVPKKFLALKKTVTQLHDMGCYVVVPHVDAPMVGLGRRRLARVAAKLGVFGYELITPYFTSEESLPELQAIGTKCDLLPLGGSDAHFTEDLYRVILEFPGSTVREFEQSWHDRTVVPTIGREGPRKTWRRQLKQQRRALVEQPSQQLRAWVRNRMDGSAQSDHQIWCPDRA